MEMEGKKNRTKEFLREYGNIPSIALGLSYIYDIEASIIYGILNNDHDAYPFNVVWDNNHRKFKPDINTQNHYGWSFLHMAIRHDKIQIVEYLLEKGININIVDSVGWTPLMEAIMDDKPKIVQLLVDKKADQTLANKRGATAKMLIMKFSRQSMMGMLN